MMKNIYRYISIALLALVATSCSNFAEPDVDPQDGQGGEQSGKFTMMIRTGRPATRTWLDAANPTHIDWLAGDRIGMFVERSADGYQIQTNQTLEVLSLEETGLFTGDMPIRHIGTARSKFYAYYPASATYDADTYLIKGEIPVSQPQDFVGAYDFMIARPIEDDYEEAADGSPFLCSSILEFPREGQIFTTLCITLPRMTAANYPQYSSYSSEAINSISISTESISARDIYLAGEFMLDVRSVDNYPILTKYGGSKRVNVTCTTPLATNTENTLYLTVLASGEIPAGLRVTVDTDHGHATWTTKQPIRMDRGTLCTLTMPDNWNNWTTPTDLSLYGTANCYVVKPNDANFTFTYKFDATLRGNGIDYTNDSSLNNGLQYYSARIDKSLIADAVLVWETVQEYEVYSGSSWVVNPLNRNVIYPTTDVANAGTVVDTKCVRYNPYNNCVYFTPGTVEGNALIAIRDDDQNILWSWHIWVASDADLINNGAAITTEKRMMTRNLGALNNDIGNSTAASYLRNSGMHYQWGRKDPFIPLRNNQQFSSTTNKGDGVVSWGIARIGTEVLATDFDGRNGSLVYANSHPNKLINSTSNSAPNDWFTNSASISICNYLWGGGYYYRLVDGKVSNEVHEVAATKSLFDPCPLGYRMPVVGVWGFDRYYGQTGQSVDMENAIAGENQNRWFYNTSVRSFFYSPTDASTNRHGVTYVQNDATSIYYPATGQIPGCGQYTWQNAGSECRYWCATVHGPQNVGNNADNDRNYHSCTTWMRDKDSRSVIQPANNYRRESLRPVRCQFDQFFHDSYK